MSKEYDEYLTNHIDNVWKGYRWVEKYAPEILNKIDNIKEFEKQLRAHDKSKWSDEEYDAYDKYFYGKKDQAEFDLAWAHHQKLNEHHWQYWLLFNDEDGVKTLDMPYEYIVEMILDWWTFSWSKNNLNEIFKWYELHDINVSKNTRKEVENILDVLKDAIDQYEVDTE